MVASEVDRMGGEKKRMRQAARLEGNVVHVTLDPAKGSNCPDLDPDPCRACVYRPTSCLWGPVEVGGGGRIIVLLGGKAGDIATAARYCLLQA